MLKKILLQSTSLFVLVVSISTYAQTVVDGANPETIYTIAKGYGSATLETDDYGDPIIEARIDGIRYNIIFNGCENGRNCSFILFSAGWTYDNKSVSLEALNQWNYESNFGKAYLDDDNDPILEFPVNLQFGVTYKNLDDTFDWWRAVLAEFSDEVLDNADNQNYNKARSI